MAAEKRPDLAVRPPCIGCRRVMLEQHAAFEGADELELAGPVGAVARGRERLVLQQVDRARIGTREQVLVLPGRRYGGADGLRFRPDEPVEIALALLELDPAADRVGARAARVGAEQGTGGGGGGVFDAE